MVGPFTVLFNGRDISSTVHSIRVRREDEPMSNNPAEYAEQRFRGDSHPMYEGNEGRRESRIVEDEMHTFFETSTAIPTPADILTEWWLELAREEARRVVPKAVEYGSTDLRDIGVNIARLCGRTVTDAEAEELGIYFYLEGKFARWRSAIMEGRPVSDDTLHDIGVYVRMAQRVRHSGNWPGIDMREVPWHEKKIDIAHDTPYGETTFYSGEDKK